MTYIMLNSQTHLEPSNQPQPRLETVARNHMNYILQSYKSQWLQSCYEVANRTISLRIFKWKPNSRKQECLGIRDKIALRKSHITQKQNNSHEGIWQHGTGRWSHKQLRLFQGTLCLEPPMVATLWDINQFKSKKNRTSNGSAVMTT